MDDRARRLLPFETEEESADRHSFALNLSKHARVEFKTQPFSPSSLASRYHKWAETDTLHRTANDYPGTLRAHRTPSNSRAILAIGSWILLPSLLSSSSGALDLLGITYRSDGAFVPLDSLCRFATRGTLQGRNNNLGQRVLPEFWTAPIGAVRTRNLCLDALYLESRNLQ